MEDSVFVPMKTLNEARHQALENLKEKLLRKYRRNVGDERVKRIAEETPAKIRDVVIHDNVPRNKEEYIPVYVSCENEDASEVLCQKTGIQGIYLPYALMEKHLQTGLDNGKEMYLSLPHITRENHR